MTNHFPSSRETEKSPPPSSKFTHPDLTAKGERRARVALRRLETLWFNTGALCNIECANCYIESGPKNDRLSYLSRDEAKVFLDEIEQKNIGADEIGFTGGEPFMNPEFLLMMQDALERGFNTLTLTNATAPMQRPRVQKGLVALAALFGPQMTFRISLDHYTQKLHERERGPDSWDKALAGLDWLAELAGLGVTLQIAGRTVWGEAEANERAGYAELINARGWPIHADAPDELVLFPEIDKKTDVPEITVSCWGVLGVRPDSMMCASSRMVIKRKDAARPQVLPCTLIAYDPAFEMGESLSEAANADGGMFENGAVKLCHPYCAQFCVLGGGSCTA